VKKLIALAAAAGGLSLLAFAPSATASEVCYDVDININGTPVVQSGCQDIPDLPPAP
jgi:type 1 fimbria pilin